MLYLLQGCRGFLFGTGTTTLQTNTKSFALSGFKEIQISNLNGRVSGVKHTI